MAIYLLTFQHLFCLVVLVDGKPSSRVCGTLCNAAPLCRYVRGGLIECVAMQLLSFLLSEIALSLLQVPWLVKLLVELAVEKH